MCREGEGEEKTTDFTGLHWTTRNSTGLKFVVSCWFPVKSKRNLAGYVVFFITPKKDGYPIHSSPTILSFPLDVLQCLSIQAKKTVSLSLSLSLRITRIDTTRKPCKHYSFSRLINLSSSSVNRPTHFIFNMLSKTIIMILGIVALFATMTMARSLEVNSDDSVASDQPRFSLRELFSLVNAKRRYPWMKPYNSQIPSNDDGGYLQGTSNGGARAAVMEEKLQDQ